MRQPCHMFTATNFTLQTYGWVARRLHPRLCPSLASSHSSLCPAQSCLHSVLPSYWRNDSTLWLCDPGHQVGDMPSAHEGSNAVNGCDFMTLQLSLHSRILSFIIWRSVIQGVQIDFDERVRGFYLRWRERDENTGKVYSCSLWQLQKPCCTMGMPICDMLPYPQLPFMRSLGKALWGLS